MKRLFTLILLTYSVQLWAQTAVERNLYRPEDDARAELQKAAKYAKLTGRNVFVQVGGNWCGPCLKFHHFVSKDSEISELLRTYFVVYHLNYSRENPNAEVLGEFGNPQLKNVPVFLILDENGNLLHTQRVMDLVNNLGYDRRRIIDFLRSWRKG